MSNALGGVAPPAGVNWIVKVAPTNEVKLNGFSSPYERLILLVNSEAICAPDKRKFEPTKRSSPMVTGSIELSTLIENKFFKSSILFLPANTGEAGTPLIPTGLGAARSLICIKAVPLPWKNFKAPVIAAAVAPVD